MAYGSKNPNLSTMILTDQVAASVPNAPSGSHRLIDRNGALFIQNSSGSETAISGGGGSGGLTPSYRAANFTAATANNYLVNTTAGAITATLPSGASGATIQFTDDALTWDGTSTHLTIAPASGQKFQGLANNETLICDVKGAWVQLNWDNTNNYWTISTGGFATAVSTSAEKNYTLAAASTATGWVVSGAVTATTDITAADLPRALTTTTGILFASGSVADYARIRFVIDTADYNKKLKIQHDQKTISWSTANDWRLELYATTDATYATGLTRQVLGTDSSSTSLLPNLTGTYRTSFDSNGSGGAINYELRFIRNATSGNLVISDLLVGPGFLVQGAAVSQWVENGASYSFVAGALGTPTNVKIFERRVGDTLHIRGQFIPSVAGGVIASIILPSSYSIDMSKFSSLADTYTGRWFRGGGASVFAATQGILFADSHGGTIDRVFFSAVTESSGDYTQTLASSLFNPGDHIEFDCNLPISQWSGAGTINVVSNDCEYVSNSSTNDGPDTSSFAYGPGGSQFINITAARSKTVQFITPISASDKLSVEFSTDSGATWNDTASASQSSSFLPYIYQGTANDYGIGLQPSSATQRIVIFGKYRLVAASATYGANGTDWSGVAASATYKWRVKKCSGGQAVGFSSASAVSAGLIDTQTQTIAGVKTFKDMPYVRAVYAGTYTTGTNTVGTGSTSFTVATDIGGNMASSVFTAPSAGRYLITNIFNIATVSGPPTVVEFVVQINGSTDQNRFPRLVKTLATNDSGSASGVWNLAAGDTIKMVVAVTGGTSLTFDGAGYSTITISKIS